ncbi:SH3 domain-containing protein [uncultured Winogradskyella sp.]|uniref:SH3 domain-containing protein n=1 Tax=uncultured Winogradskyella sp. TaxID=395353 RepID=UPI00261A3CF1|nr:SH3 domain-containing protein [uncultured Winogradskyella sp.]
MNKTLIICLVIPMFLFSQSEASQNYYYINAENGLNVRSEPKLSSEKMAKLPHGVIVEKLTDTNHELIITDNGAQIKGHWVKIKYSNYTYLVSEETESFEREGYVFNGYLKPLANKNSMTITKINKSQFEEWLTTVPKQVYISKKISNLDSVKAILKDRVDWMTEADLDEGDYINCLIKSITIANGQKLIINQNSNDCYFAEDASGYYPEYDILVLEGGHSIDVCFSIKTGETTDIIGNPEYIIASPKNTYRLNGTFGGQECVSYFFQKKVNGKFIYLTEFDETYFPCRFKEFHWITETKFIYSTTYSIFHTIDSDIEYFKGEINSKKD